MFPRTRSLVAALCVAATPIAATLAAPAAAQAQDVRCDLVVASSGKDSAAGTADAPLATTTRLSDVLQPGQTGCIRGTVSGELSISDSGVTVTSEPGQRGKLTGEVVIRGNANNVTVSNLDLHAIGYKFPSPVIFGDDAVISGNDITNGKAQMLCMLLGSFNHNGNHVAERTLIANNRIHDCGAGDNHQHGMYLENTQGVRIVGNEFVDNADRAIQLFPSAQGTVIEGNVLDGNGEGIIFSGLDGVPSNNNVVRNNVLTGARIRSVVESYYPEGTPRGTGNLVENNCVHSSTSRKPIDLAGGGFVARNNLEVDPQYVDVAARDLRLRPGSPCAAILEAGRAGINLPVQTAAPTAPTAPASQPAPALTETIANPAPSPLTLSAVHEGTELRVKVRLAPNAKIAKKPVARLARVEYRASKRAPWRLVGVGRVARNRSFTAKRRVFAAAGTRIQVRAMVIRSGRPSAIAFSAVKRAPQL